MRRLIVFFCIINLIFLYGCSQLSIEEKAEKYLERGRSHLDKMNIKDLYSEKFWEKNRFIREYNHAIKEFDKAIGIYPDFVLAYFYRGAAHLYRGFRNSDALADYIKILEIDPDFYAADILCNNMAAIYYYFEDLDNALFYAEKALEKNPVLEGSQDIIYRVNLVKAAADRQMQRRMDIQKEMDKIFGQINKNEYQDSVFLEFLYSSPALVPENPYQIGEKYKTSVIACLGSKEYDEFYPDANAIYRDPRRLVQDYLFNIENYDIYYTVTGFKMAGRYVFSINLEYVEL